MKAMQRSDSVFPFRSFVFLWLGLVILWAVYAWSRPNSGDWLQPAWVARGAHALGLIILLLAPQVQLLLRQFFLPLALAFAVSGIVIIEWWDIQTNLRIIENNPALLLQSLSRLFIMSTAVAIMLVWHYGWGITALFVGGILFINWRMTIRLDNLIEFAAIYRPMNVWFVMTLLLITYLISRLGQVEQENQQAMAQINRKMANYVVSLEELTISRERNRMARELHDTLAHTLSALSVQLETMRAYWDVDDTTSKELLDQALASTRSGLHETRRALQSLRASPLEDLGLVLALQGLAESAELRTQFQLKLDLPAQPLNLSPLVEQTVYRVAQEAVTNVIKHATAQTLSLSLNVGDALELIVADDGVGFTAEGPGENGHYGLVGLHERAELVNGIVTVESYPMCGTSIKLTIDQE